MLRFKSFDISLTVTIRTCKESDLTKMDGFGKYREHRNLIREAYSRQQKGEVTMLIAEANNFPIGQVWVDFSKKRDSAKRK